MDSNNSPTFEEHQSKERSDIVIAPLKDHNIEDGKIEFTSSKNKLAAI